MKLDVEKILKFVHDRKKHLTKNTPGLIQSRITWKGKVKYKTTEIHVLPEQWDEENQIIIKHPQKKILNDKLYSIKESLEAFLIAAQKRGQSKSIENIIHNLGGKIELFKEYAKYFLTTQENVGKLTKNSIAAYNSAIKEVNIYSPNLELKEIDSFWINNFSLFLSKRSKRFKKNEGETLSESTIQQTINRLSSIIKQAYKERLINENPFDFIEKIHISEENRTKAIDLTDEEIALFYDFDYSVFKKKEKKIRENIDAFLLANYNFMPFSDLKTLSVSHYDSDTKTIKKVRQKTKRYKKTFYQPLLKMKNGNQIIKILENYTKGKNPNDLVFTNLMPYSTYLMWLKKMSTLLGINKNITTHSGRHTSLKRYKEESTLPDEYVGIMSAQNANTVRKYRGNREKSLDKALDLINKTNV